MKWFMVVALLMGSGAWGRERSPAECKVAAKNYLAICEKQCAKSLKNREARVAVACKKSCRDQLPALEKGCISGKHDTGKQESLKHRH